MEIHEEFTRLFNQIRRKKKKDTDPIGMKCGYVKYKCGHTKKMITMNNQPFDRVTSTTNIFVRTWHPNRASLVLTWKNKQRKKQKQGSTFPPELYDKCDMDFLMSFWRQYAQKWHLIRWKSHQFHSKCHGNSMTWTCQRIHFMFEHGKK